MFRRDLWRSLVQLFAQSSNNFKVRFGCSASHPAKFQKSLEKGGHTGSLENLLKRLIVLIVKAIFPCIQSKIPHCNFQLLSLVLPLCVSEFVLFFFMVPLQGVLGLVLGFSSAFSYGHSARQPSPMVVFTACWGHISPHGAHPWWRCQVFLALYQTLWNAIHSAVRFQAVYPNPLKLMVQPVFNHLVVHLSSPHLPSFGYQDMRLFSPFCAYRRFFHEVLLTT